MEEIVREVKAEGGSAEGAVQPEAQKGERPIEPGVDDLAPVARREKPPPVETLDQRILVDDETIVVDETVLEVPRVREERRPENENGRASTRGPAEILQEL